MADIHQQIKTLQLMIDDLTVEINDHMANDTTITGTEERRCSTDERTSLYNMLAEEKVTMAQLQTAAIYATIKP